MAFQVIETEIDRITVEDEHGNELEGTVFSAFKHLETDRTYILYYLKEDDLNDDLEEVIAYALTFAEDGETLVEIEEDEDWEIVESYLTYLLEED